MTVNATAEQPNVKQTLDRMDDWANDDLLLTPAARERLELEYPRALRVFDWPELRAHFATIDQHAGKSRKRRRRNGVIAAAVTTTGAALSALLPIAQPLGWDVERGLYTLAAAMGLLGFVATIWLTHGDRAVDEWLESRLQTERLRQLYFQVLGNHPDLAARAFTDDVALSQWRKTRNAALGVVIGMLGNPRALLTATIEDVNQRGVWLLDAFNAPPDPLKSSPDLDAYFAAFRRQRLGVQGAYVREKLAPGFGSPRSWHLFIKGTSYATALAALFASIIIAVMLYNGAGFEAAPAQLLLSLIAFIGIVAMFFKLLGEGLQVRADLERYLWYRDAIADLDARFNDRDPNVRIALLREMERASYREMREFLKTHREARFSCRVTASGISRAGWPIATCQ